MRSSRLLWGASLLLLVVLSSATSAAAAPSKGTLPLTRVRFYETGVGYFERSGAAPVGETSLPVPAGHLDDALKTLEGQITQLRTRIAELTSEAQGFVRGAKRELRRL